MTDGPEYARLMELIRARIVSGEYPTGTAIPSTSAWQRDGWSRTVVREAVKRLQQKEILRGQGGKAVFVRATPEQAARQHADLDTLNEQMAELQQEVAELRKRVGRMAATLATVARKPRGSKHGQAEAVADDGRR